MVTVFLTVLHIAGLEFFVIILIVLGVCGAVGFLLCIVIIYCVLRWRRNSVVQQTVINTVPDGAPSYLSQPVAQLNTYDCQPLQVS